MQREMVNILNSELDMGSIKLAVITALALVLGAITLNQVATCVGILAAVTTIIYNVLRTYQALKGKKDGKV